MVILQIIDSLYRGGAQKVVLDIVRALPGHSHIVCYWSNEEDLKEEFLHEGVELIQIPFKGATSLRSYFAFRKIVARMRPDVVHTHMFIPNLLARLVPDKYVRISTYHGEVFLYSGFVGSIIRILERMTLSRSHEVIAVSHYIKLYLKRELNTTRPINVVHNYGHTLPDVKPNLDQVPVRLLATSNNQPYKDYPLLIRAMGTITDKSITLDIYGNGMEPLKNLVSELGITNVKFKGVIPDVATVMNEYSAFVITSHSGEGFSLSLLEAMNAGLPIVCSNLPQFLEATGQDAFVFERSNLNDLVVKLNLLVRNRHDLNQYSEAIRKRALLFSEKNFVKNIADIYARYLKA